MSAHSLPNRVSRLLDEAAGYREAAGAPLPPAERGDVERIGPAVAAAVGTAI